MPSSHSWAAPPRGQFPFRGQLLLLGHPFRDQFFLLACASPLGGAFITASPLGGAVIGTRPLSGAFITASPLGGVVATTGPFGDAESNLGRAAQEDSGAGRAAQDGGGDPSTTKWPSTTNGPICLL